MDDLKVYQYYLGASYKPGRVVRSPLRKDGKPSFSTKKYRDRLYWKDFNYTSVYGYDALGLVCCMEININTRQQAWEFIKDSIFQGKDVFKGRSFTTESYVEDLSYIKSKLDFKYSYLEPEHYMYYDKLLVPSSILHEFKMMSLKQILKDDYAFWNETPGENIGFFKKIGSGNKGYMPYNKFYNSKFPKVIHQGIDILEGYEELPRNGKLLILGKSLKDILVQRSAGYFGSCMSGENVWNIFDRYYYELSERFEEILAWGDPDPAGIRMMNYICSKIPKAKRVESRIDKDSADIVFKTQNHFWLNTIIDYAKRFG